MLRMILGHIIPPYILVDRIQDPDNPWPNISGGAIKFVACRAR